MSYTSLMFLAFVALTALLYFVFPVKKYKWTVLLVSSYVFYFCAGAKYALFILLTTVTTYLTALLLGKASEKAARLLSDNKENWDKQTKKAFKNKVKNKKRLILSFCLVLNFGILAFLKYYNFLALSLFSLPALDLFLPLGISFYTFQSMGYVIDVYREKFPPEKNVAKLALFVSFFPQIIQGPIGFYDKLAAWLYRPNKFSYSNLSMGVRLMTWGFFKKLVIADRAAMFINAVTENYTAAPGGILALTVLMYALCLYADFSGGIDITRGVAKILGIDMSQNFKRPYFAKSLSDYWRRWHITLGEWFKNYLFYPIAMSSLFTKLSKSLRKSSFGKSKTGAHISKALPSAIASFIVFFMVGLWHGANWKYIGFGIWNGAVIMLSTLLKPAFEAICVKLHINTGSFVYKCFCIFRTFLLVAVGYVFDIAPDLGSSLATFGSFFKGGLGSLTGYTLTLYDFALLLFGAAAIFTVSAVQEKHPQKSVRQMLDSKPLLNWLLLLACILVILTFGIYGPGYNPADFVYMQF